MTSAQGFPLLRCAAGDVPLGLAAEEVRELVAAREGAPHIATLLGLAPGAPGPAQRMVLLADGARSVMVNVDGPVQVRRLGGAEILRLPALFRRTPIHPVIGFLHEKGRVVLLLDVAGMIDRAGQHRPPPATNEAPPPRGDRP